MALTAAQIETLAGILEIPASYIDAQITYLSGLMTAEKEAKIEAELLIWSTNDLDDDFDKLRSNNSNYGFDSDPERLRDAIRNRLATAFERPDWCQNAYTFQVVRG